MRQKTRSYYRIMKKEVTNRKKNLIGWGRTVNLLCGKKKQE